MEIAKEPKAPPARNGPNTGSLAPRVKRRVNKKKFSKSKSKYVLFLFPGIDLALLSLANHSIISHGSFGMWGALLAGGDTLVSANHLTSIWTKEIFDGQLQNWEFI